MAGSSATLFSFIGDGVTWSRHIARFKRSESGVAVLEFVIVMPMTFLLFALLLDFGRIFWGYQSVIAGVRDATRYLARVAPVDICVTGGSLSSFEPTLLNIVAESAQGTSVLPGGFRVNSVDADFTCFTGAYRTSPAAVASVTANIDVEFMLGRWFGIAGDELGAFSATVTDASKVYGQ